MPRSKTIGKPRKPGGQRVNNSLTSPKELELQKRRAEALDYRKQGYTFAQIGEAMECDASTAHDYVVRAMADITREPAEQLLKMELERLDDLQSAHYAAAVKGDIPAGDMILRVMSHRARYLGLYADSKEGVAVEINRKRLNGHGGEGAEHEGIRVVFVRPTRREGDDEPL